MNSNTPRIVVLPGDGIGAAGDYVFYSLYKHLPIPDGALLLARATAAARPDAIARAVVELGGNAPASVPWVTRRVIQRLAPGLAGRLRRGRDLPFDVDRAHKDLDFHPEHGTDRRGGQTVLTGPGLCDEFVLAHVLGQQTLAQAVV